MFFPEDELDTISEDEFDALMKEESEHQRHLTQEEFAQINPNHQLLDFEIFRRANDGDEAALDAVMEYCRYTLDGYLGPNPDEIDLEVHADLLRAFRTAIEIYEIHDDDTYFCYDEILDIAHTILDGEDLLRFAMLQEGESFPTAGVLPS